MRVVGYGIELKRITIEDIELIREWRNSAFVKMHMEYQEEITSEMQLKWFHSINTIHNNYCLIKYKNDYVGVIHGSNIDWETKITCNGGIFMKDESYTLTDIPLRASLLMTDISFALGNRKTIIKVLNSNTRALFYNKSIGYKLISRNEVYSNFELIEEEYVQCAEKFKSLIHLDEERKIILVIEDTEDLIEKNVMNHFDASLQKNNWNISLQVNEKNKR